MRHLLILSTGQHVGKTTVSLGLVKHLQNKFKNTNKLVAYCKPVGQQHVPVGDNIRVDKDSYLFKEYFGLVHDYKDMSPVIFPRGFTRDFIDGKVTEKELSDTIATSHHKLYHSSNFLVCEGTGHTGVGSICELNNAQVASHLNIDVICIALGGLGSSFDQLAMNRELLLKHNVNLKGVILNKVDPTKIDMVQDYFSRALQRWNVPLLGCVPEVKDLACPTMADYSKLLKSDFLAGVESSNRYFLSSRLALAPVDASNIFKPIPNQLVITHSDRLDVIESIIQNEEASISSGKKLKSGLILTGWKSPSPDMIKRLNDINIPCIYVSPEKADSYNLAARVAGYIAKLKLDDTKRLNMAADLVIKHCDFKFLEL